MFCTRTKVKDFYILYVIMDTSEASLYILEKERAN
jgi:hypothetical protein